MRRIVAGPADDSYGIEVAKLAGLPGSVTKRAHAVLRQLADVLKNASRAEDMVFRYGGDEFLLIFSKIGEEVFYERLKQLRRVVQETKLPDYPEVKLDVSLGGVYRVHPLSEAIRQADLRMYDNKAKHANVNPAACR